MSSSDPDMVTLALSKGRILEDTLPVLAAAGIEPEVDPGKSRKLVFETNKPGLRLLVIRASDVPTFVAYGAADVGVAGKDVLIEHGGADLYEPLDLGIATCRLMTAGLPGAMDAAQHRPLRVATKYVETTRAHFARIGRQVEIIKLYGSMELAPLVGLADVIVDLVDTGNTLRANGLEPFEVLEDISARLVVNKAAQKMKHAAISELVELFDRGAAGQVA
ncbi:ATP phosphoribosyltransferase [Salinisphaera hydrothermalis]|uniref:ATP phosphoribosyltransferase n=1 Tax=Salinisphaera hydrothermalis (strain C41B8) TaxID=1304275 RepID=A0A084IP86_SALHC|nr:ATP phosphoribosyltransferase [Salinisphaera hydrothermalis]KEZ78520.1 ATP phosphoribosyltransferase catalytic subunit [Salinisphaera hydrothermalis C41B8]